MSETFYDVFINECNKPTLIIDSFVTENQKIAFRDYGGFLDHIPVSDYSKIARNIITDLEDYNRRTDGDEFHVVGEKEGEKLKEKDIKIIKKFLSVLTNKNKSVHRQKDCDDTNTMIPLVNNFLSLHERNEVYYFKRRVSTKTPLKNTINQIIKNYKIPNATYSAKTLIDKLDNPD
jgi:hypothetical protein